MMVFSTGIVDKEGVLHLTDIGKGRAKRAAEAYYSADFSQTPESILVSGGFSKNFIHNPPHGREATLLADYMMRAYDIPSSAFLIEDQSTDTIENLTLSHERYPEWFEDVLDEESKLGLVSDPYHLTRAAMAACALLSCSESQLVKLPTDRFYNKLGEMAALGIMLDKIDAMKKAAGRQD